MKVIQKLGILLGVALGGSMLAPVSYALDAAAEIKACAQLTADAERLECFDGLATAVSEAQARGEVVASAPQEVKPLDDTIGGGRFREESDAPMAKGRVTFCQRSYDNKWLFVFANGQVWKQSGEKRRAFKECDIDVVIAKDFFGFYLQPVGMKEKTRVRRVK